MDEPIDTSFDMRSDTPNGKDPDSHSPTLRKYHRALWSKPLPGGALFDLSASKPGVYLHHTSELGEFRLSSDTVIRTFKRVRRASGVISQIPVEEQEAFSRLGYSIGGMMIFPGNRIKGKWTINQTRGMTRSIDDRFDLTLECIRRHYAGLASPLSDVLARYSRFFDLFVDFRGYVDYFLLQDLVTPEYGAVLFFSDFDDFATAALPATLAEYEAYRTLTIKFVKARNARIEAYAGLAASSETPG